VNPVIIPLIVIAILALLIVPCEAQLEPAGYGYNVTMEYIPLWITFQYASSYNITSYTFKPFADFTYINETAHNNSWMILGSNDGHTVTVLDTQFNISLTSGATQSFNLPKTGFYKYYYVYLFTGFGTTGEKMEVHLYAAAEEPVPIYVYMAGESQPVEPGHLILGTALFLAAIGWRRTVGGRV